jgi:hypothetical protein
MKPAPPLTNRRTVPGHSGHLASGVSVMACLRSNRKPHDPHSYS